MDSFLKQLFYDKHLWYFQYHKLLEQQEFIDFIQEYNQYFDIFDTDSVCNLTDSAYEKNKKLKSHIKDLESEIEDFESEIEDLNSEIKDLKEKNKLLKQFKE
jgi:peptidoglycan hydrolase CwlO-like protein